MTVPTIDELVRGPLADLEARFTAQHRAPVNIPPTAHPCAPARAIPGGATWVVQPGVSGGAWLPCWKTWAPRLVNEGLLAGVPYLNDATGAMDIRLRLQADGGIDIATDSVAIAPNAVGGYLFRWLHNLPPWDTTNVDLTVEARVTAATVNVFIPYGGAIIQTDPRECVADGTP